MALVYNGVTSSKTKTVTVSRFCFFHLRNISKIVVCSHQTCYGMQTLDISWVSHVWLTFKVYVEALWTLWTLLMCQKLKTLQAVQIAPQRPSTRLHTDFICKPDAPDAQNVLGVNTPLDIWSSELTKRKLVSLSPCIWTTVMPFFTCLNNFWFSGLLSEASSQTSRQIQ